MLRIANGFIVESDIPEAFGLLRRPAMVQSGGGTDILPNIKHGLHAPGAD